MKYLIGGDLHGSLEHYRLFAEIASREKPDVIVLLGDLINRNPLSEACRAVLASLPVVPLAVEGNCDYGTLDDLPEIDFRQKSFSLDGFSRTLFFTHGDHFSCFHIPPGLKPGDVLCYGHYHKGELKLRDGVLCANCGSFPRPSAGFLPSYLVIDDDGVYVRSAADSTDIEKVLFKDLKK